MENQEKELMTIKEAAAFLKVSEKTLHSYLEKGWLTALRSGRQERSPIRLDAEEVRNFYKAERK